MIHLVDGPSAAGKSTFAAHLARVLRLPLYVDVGRKIAVREGVEGSQIQAMALSFDHLIDQMAMNHDFVLVRYWPTVYAYKRMEPERPELPKHLQCDVGSRAIVGMSRECLYYVTAHLDVIKQRLTERREDVARAELEQETFESIFSEIESAGVPVIRVDGTRGLWSVRPHEVEGSP